MTCHVLAKEMENFFAFRGFFIIFCLSVKHFFLLGSKAGITPHSSSCLWISIISGLSTYRFTKNVAESVVSRQGYTFGDRLLQYPVPFSFSPHALTLQEIIQYVYCSKAHKTTKERVEFCLLWTNLVCGCILSGVRWSHVSGGGWWKKTASLCALNEHTHILNCLISSAQCYLYCCALWSGGLAGSGPLHPYIIKARLMRRKLAMAQLVSCFLPSLWLCSVLTVLNYWLHICPAYSQPCNYSIQTENIEHSTIKRGKKWSSLERKKDAA